MSRVFFFFVLRPLVRGFCSLGGRPFEEKLFTKTKPKKKKKVFLHSSLSLASASMGCHSSLLSSLLLTVTSFASVLNSGASVLRLSVGSALLRAEVNNASVIQPVSAHHRTPRAECAGRRHAKSALAPRLALLFVRPNNYIRLNKVWPAAPPTATPQPPPS